MADSPERVVVNLGDVELSEVCLAVGNTDFNVHKMVLASRSTYFKTLFFGDSKEKNENRITIDADPAVFKRMLELLYDCRSANGTYDSPEVFWELQKLMKRWKVHVRWEYFKYFEDNLYKTCCTHQETTDSPDRIIINFGDVELSDVCLVVGDTNFNVHRMVLANHSSYFKALFFRGFKEENEKRIAIDDNPVQFQRMLEIMYDGECVNEDFFKCGAKFPEVFWEEGVPLWDLLDYYDMQLGLKYFEERLNKYCCAANTGPYYYGPYNHDSSQKPRYSISTCSYCALRKVFAMQHGIELKVQAYYAISIANAVRIARRKNIIIDAETLAELIGSVMRVGMYNMNVGFETIQHYKPFSPDEEDDEEENEEYSETVTDSLERVIVDFGDVELSDVCLIVGNTDFHVHKVVLASRSTYFKTLFFGDSKEKNDERITIDADPATFQLMLEFLYNCRYADDDEYFKRNPEVFSELWELMKRCQEMAESPGKIVVNFGDVELSDACLVVGDTDFNVHKMVLANHSSLFKALFFHDFKEKNEKRIAIEADPEPFQRMLEIMYQGECANEDFFKCGEKFPEVFWKEGIPLWDLLDYYDVPSGLMYFEESVTKKYCCPNTGLDWYDAFDNLCCSISTCPYCVFRKIFAIQHGWELVNYDYYSGSVQTAVIIAHEKNIAIDVETLTELVLNMSPNTYEWGHNPDDEEEVEYYGPITEQEEEGYDFPRFYYPLLYDDYEDKEEDWV